MRKKGDKSFGSLLNVYWDIRAHPLMQRLVDFRVDEYGKMIVLTLNKLTCDYQLLTVLRTSEKCFRVHVGTENKTFRKAKAAQAYILDKLSRFYDYQDFKNSLSGHEYNLYVAGKLKYKYPFKK